MASINKKINISIIVALVLMLSTAILTARRLNNDTDSITRALPTVAIDLGGQTIKTEVVSGAEDMYRGLSDRASLCQNCGMLFVFSDSMERNFVMRRMNFPLDIIFLNHGKIINIAANLTPEGKQPKMVYASAGPADRVLEINGGLAAQWGLNVGDTIAIPK